MCSLCMSAKRLLSPPSPPCTARSPPGTTASANQPRGPGPAPAVSSTCQPLCPAAAAPLPSQAAAAACWQAAPHASPGGDRQNVAAQKLPAPACPLSEGATSPPNAMMWPVCGHSPPPSLQPAWVATPNTERASGIVRLLLWPPVLLSAPAAAWLSVLAGQQVGQLQLSVGMSKVWQSNISAQQPSPNTRPGEV